MATHSSVPAWRIPGTEEPGGLPSVGSHRVGHDWSDVAAAAEKRDIPVIPEPWQRDRALLWGLWRSGEEWAAGSSCISKKRIGNDGESAVLRVKNPGGVVVVCVILCVCLDGLFFSEKTNRRWCRRNSTPFFSCSFKICKHLIFTQVIRTGGRINMNVWGCEQDFTAIQDCFLHFRFLHWVFYSESNWPPWVRPVYVAGRISPAWWSKGFQRLHLGHFDNL